MNKEIKFRVWNNIVKKMLYSNGDLMICLCGTLYSTWDKQHEDPKDFILNQFTGIRDGNNNEIYEDDIVELVSNKERYKVKYNSRKAMFVLGRDFANDIPLDSCEIEIIGNIHKHPERLK